MNAFVGLDVTTGAFERVKGVDSAAAVGAEDFSAAAVAADEDADEAGGEGDAWWEDDGGGHPTVGARGCFARFHDTD